MSCPGQTTPHSSKLNATIDQALLDPSAEQQQKIKQCLRDTPVRKLAERIRQRATVLGKSRRSDRAGVLARRNELMLVVYAAAVPSGWACGWVDGSSIQSERGRLAGIGGLLIDSEGIVIAQISRSVGDQDAFGAELAALATILQNAIEHQQLWLWVYTDNSALVHLWQTRRDDARLDEIRKLGGQLEKFALQVIPRLHNQPANALARAAIKR